MNEKKIVCYEKKGYFGGYFGGYFEGYLRGYMYVLLDSPFDTGFLTITSLR
jgi:hypothetical protein